MLRALLRLPAAVAAAAPTAAVRAAATQAEQRPMFAVVQLSGKQFKVQPDDVIVTNRLLCDVGEQVRLNKVLLAATASETHIGTPLVPSAYVTATAIEHTKTEKVQVFKKKRRKGYAVRQGHRQDITLLRINEVAMH
eukprot:m.33786 g.33786  ORF g.33786 m.33786 type:complete len:137 (-) comp11053_c0_seq1:40-450(-)